MQPDTIEVRADERLDQHRLAGFLRGKLPGTDQPLTVRQFGGGAANLTYLLEYGAHEYGAHEYVLRRPPLGPVARSAHDMGREYKVLSVLSGAFPPAPRAYLHCDDLDIIGAEFFVMERRRGIVVRGKLPDAYAGLPGAARQMSLALVDALADLHAVDYAAIGLSDLGRPAGFIERQIDGWYKRWQAAKAEEVAEMDVVYHWLHEHVPASTQVSLVHSDYKLDNVMFAPDDPSQIRAIFDWDMCTLGDPLSDLGALLAYWTEPADQAYVHGLSTMPTGDLDFLTRAELVQRYAARSGRPVSDIHFYHTLGLFRIVVIIAQISIRYVRGQTSDQRFASLGPAIPLMAKAAQALALSHHPHT